MTDFSENQSDDQLTPELAETTARCISEAFAAGGVAGFRVFLQQHEHEPNTIVHDGKPMRLKWFARKIS